MSIDKVVFPYFDDELEAAVSSINMVQKQIEFVISILENRKRLSVCDQKIFIHNVKMALSWWTGHTYVGKKKSKCLSESYQEFYCSLYKLLSLISNNKLKRNRRLVKSFSCCLYRGKIYRYLGHGKPNENVKEKIIPNCDNLFVSWSKSSCNNYILGKLYGAVTLISATISSPYYGIDLDALGVSAGEEQEVVFPTIDSIIDSIKYIDRVSNF